MIGKAREIQTAHFSARNREFHQEMKDWCANHPRAEIIDIKFTATAVPSEEDVCHALIIYKEASQ